jgi:hypothetical protein
MSLEHVKNSCGFKKKKKIRGDNSKRVVAGSKS